MAGYAKFIKGYAIKVIAVGLLFYTPSFKCTFAKIYSMHKGGGNRKGKKATTGGERPNASGRKPTRSTKPKKVQSKQPKSKDDGLIRLNKYISNSGICSRREADTYIATGSVTVNGKVIDELGYKVKLEDDVRFDGRRINPEPKTYVLLNKPKGFATTTSNEKGNTVMDLVAKATKARIKPIGRLGRNATGLLLFTNDEDVHQRFTNSKSGVSKLYQVTLSKNMKVADLDRIREGLKIEDRLIVVEDISYIDGVPKKEIGISIKHTGNSIIRTIFETLNYEVVKIDCVSFAGLTKKELPRGRYRHLTDLEISNLKML